MSIDSIVKLMLMSKITVPWGMVFMTIQPRAVQFRVGRECDNVIMMDNVNLTIAGAGLYS